MINALTYTCTVHTLLSMRETKERDEETAYGNKKKIEGIGNLWNRPTFYFTGHNNENRILISYCDYRPALVYIFRKINCIYCLHRYIESNVISHFIVSGSPKVDRIFSTIIFFFDGFCCCFVVMQNLFLFFASKRN